MRRKKKLYPGNIKAEDCISPRTSQKAIRILQQALRVEQTKTRNLQQKLRRRDSKITSTEHLLKNLKERSLIAHTHLDQYNEHSEDLVNKLSKGKVNGKYSTEVRSFALTLHFYSNRAYEYVRNIYQDKLPSVRTLRKWYQSIDGKPGCTSEALAALKIRSSLASQQGKKIICNLVMDEMSIRKQIEYNSVEKKFYGYVDFGNSFSDCDQDKLEAKEVLVFLVNAINDRFKIPVAYYFVNGLSACEKANIINEVLVFLDDADIVISSITFDGAPSNLATAKKLGASLDINNLEPYFYHPLSRQKIFVFLDICHMLKLIRNTLAHLGEMEDGNGNTIKWSYIVKLEETQSLDGVLIANKLRKKHVYFDSQKMKTSLAAQTLSSSVASALSYLKDTQNPEFQGTDATVEFITCFNNLFDIFNSKNKFGSYYKKPLNKNSSKEIFTYFDTAINYISKLRIKGRDGYTSILKSSSKTGYLGFLMAMYNFKSLYETYVLEDKLEYMLGYKFSQDHLETFFSAIRSRGGWNNNPNCMQFSNAFKKLLIQQEVKASSNANSLENVYSPSILTVSSASSVRIVDPSASFFFKYLAGNNDDDDDCIDLKDLNLTVHDVVTYIAGFVEKCLRKKMKCQLCIAGLDKLEVYSDLHLIEKKNWNSAFSGLVKPRAEIVKLCQIAEKNISEFNTNNNFSNDFYNELLRKCFLSVSSSSFDSIYSCTEHKLICPFDKCFLVKYCLEKYIKTKLAHIGKTKTSITQNKPIRQKLNKLILFSGQ